MGQQESTPPRYPQQPNAVPPNHQYGYGYPPPYPQTSQGYRYPQQSQYPQGYRYPQQNQYPQGYRYPPPYPQAPQGYIYPPPYPPQSQGYSYPPPYPPQSQGYSYPQQQGNAPGQQNPSNEEQEEEGVEKHRSLSIGDWTDNFNEASIRRKFVRKVYFILSLQLLFVSSLTATMLLVEDVTKFSRRHTWIVFLALLLQIVFLIVFACCSSVARTVPCNFILLFFFTLSNGYCVAFITSFYKVEHILLAGGICTVVCFTLTIFAIQTKWDVTGCGMFGLVALVVLMLFGIILIFYKTKMLTIIYSCLGALIFSFYIVYDTQRIMGDRKYGISPEDYIFAAIALYLDIINLFLHLLTLVNEIAKD